MPICRFATVPQCVFDLKATLTTLLMGGNKLQTLDADAFLQMKNLEFLNMSRNDLKAVPPELSLLPLK